MDSALAVRIALIIALSSALNQALKGLFQQPRPFDLDPTLQRAAAIGYGLPSGHAQTAVVQWGGLAARFRRRWVWGAAFALIFLIGLSRVYLGVHFPTDVLAGWAAGGALLALYLWRWGGGWRVSPLPRRLRSDGARGAWRHRLARGGVGGLGLLILRALLSGATVPLVLVVGLWIFVGAPWLFRHLGLAGSPEGDTDSVPTGAL